jgi:hypothetical protein
MAQPTDLTGMLTEGLFQPTQQAVPSSLAEASMRLAQSAGTGLRRGIGALTGADTRTNQEAARAAMRGLDINNPADQPKLLEIVRKYAPEKESALVAQFAQQGRVRAEKEKAQELKQSQGAVFASYVDSTFNNPELTKLAAGGVLTPNNLDSFIKDTSNATILKGSTFTVRDEKGNNFTMIPTLNNKTGKLENSYSPIGNAPSNPIGKTVVTGGEFAQTAGEAQRQTIETKGLERQEAKFQELKVAATDSIPTLNASKNNLDRATALLDSVSTGGPVNLAGTGLENFFGVKGADKAELEIILGQEMFKSLKPLFGGVISEGERQAIVDIYANLKKGNTANKGILKRLKQELNDGIVKANLYQKADNYEEFKITVKQMFPEEAPSKRRVIVFGQRDGENNE